MNPIVSLVPIRAGSKGVVGKNTRVFAGQPLYQHAVAQGLRTTDACVISTDIDEVISSGGGDRVTVHSRPSEYAKDDSPMVAVVDNVIRDLKLEYSIVVLLQCTSPVRLDSDILNAIRMYQDGRFDIVMSVTPHDRSVLKYGTIENETFIPVSDREMCFANRQSLPAVFRPNGAIYVFSASWVLANGGFSTDKIGAFCMPNERSLDIDSEEDFAAAESVFELQHDHRNTK